jgi:hypothetical protein
MYTQLKLVHDIICKRTQGLLSEEDGIVLDQNSLCFVIVGHKLISGNADYRVYFSYTRRRYFNLK